MPPPRPRLRTHNAARYTLLIIDFADPETERIWLGEGSRRLPPEIQAIARRKLRMLDAAATLDDLRTPPGNRLELLRADRAGQYSIRINQRWRICFVWLGDRCRDVEIVDYH